MTERHQSRRENNIVAADIVHGQLVLKRYDGSLVVYGDADPHILSLEPASVQASSGATTINVNGGAFENGATVEIDQVAAPTTFVSSELLTVEYTPPGSDGLVEFTVRQDPHESNSVNLEITKPPLQAPVLTSIDPNTATQGVPVTFTLTGDLFPTTLGQVKFYKGGGLQMGFVPTTATPQTITVEHGGVWNGGGGAWEVMVGASMFGPWSVTRLPVTVT